MSKQYQDKIVDIAVAREEAENLIKQKEEIEFYEKNVAYIAPARIAVEKFITREQKTNPVFLSFIEQGLRNLKNTTSKCADMDTPPYLIELFDYIDKILIYIQAMIEADKHSVSEVISQELKRNKYKIFKEVLTETIENYADVNKKVNHLSQIVKGLTSQKVTSKEEIFQYIELIINDLKSYSNSLYEKVNERIDEIRNNNIDSIEKLQQKYDEIVEIIKKEKKEIENDVKVFEPLVSDIIQTELNDKGKFIKLLTDKTENYAAVNKKIIYLSQMIETLESQEVKSKEDILKYIELVKDDLKKYSDLLYKEIDKKIDEIKKSNVDSIEKLQQQYNDIIMIIQSEKNNIEKDMKAFEPLVSDIIQTELDEKGIFIDLLTNKIIQISNEKEGELQEKFKKIVEHIVGKGTETNPKIARENTIRGFKSLKDSDVRENITRELKTLSEVDVDEILGSKILKIVDKKSSFGSTFATIGNAIANVKNTINQYVAFGGKGDDAKKFFDGFSFSVYYYNVIPQEGRTYSLPDNLLPTELKESDLNYISKFKTIIEKLDLNLKKYDTIKRSTPEIIDNEEPLDICCFVRIVDSKRAYFILSHEPSNFFKEQLDNILLKRYKNKDDMQEDLEELSKNYTIPKVDIAIFNSKGFELPSDDGKSVVTSKAGEKYLKAENEQELLIILDDIEKSFNKKQSLFSRTTKKYHGNKGVWYYWATYNKKYLAVKMLEPLSDKDREKLCGYVEKNIWNHLIKTKSLPEMQDWLNTFIQKDAGVLADKPGMFSKGRQIVNGLTLVSTLLVLVIAVVYFWNTTLLFPDLRFEIKDTKIQNENEFNRLNSKFDLTLKIFREELRSISKKAATKMELSAELSNDCAEPFIFSFHITMIDKLSEEDRTRLKRIAKNLIVLQNECKVSIILYKNDNNNWNLERAKNTRIFLIDEGVPETSVVISNEMEKQTLSGVRLKLMML